MRTDGRIKELLSAYVNERNNYHVQSGFALPATGLPGFDDWNALTRGYSQQLFTHLPTMNLAELEAFSELVAVHLNNVRMIGR